MATLTRFASDASLDWLVWRKDCVLGALTVAAVVLDETALMAMMIPFEKSWVGVGTALNFSLLRAAKRAGELPAVEVINGRA